eukprot:365471-Chlamydomonas_euryale.AAC.1
MAVIATQQGGRVTGLNRGCSWMSVVCVDALTHKACGGLSHTAGRTCGMLGKRTASTTMT